MVCSLAQLYIQNAGSIHLLQHRKKTIKQLMARMQLQAYAFNVP